ncbi:hypothetical protein YB2330_006024 [Saitoella coloradoensis]
MDISQCPIELAKVESAYHPSNDNRQGHINKRHVTETVNCAAQTEPHTRAPGAHEEEEGIVVVDGIVVEAGEEEVVIKWRWFKMGVCFFAFLVFGMNDGANGALIPFIQKHYEVGPTPVSFIFLTQFIGFVLAGLFSPSMHKRLHTTFRTVTPTLFLMHLAYALMCWGPPLPLLIAAYVLIGFSCGVQDAMYNAFIGQMKGSMSLLGMLHGCYGGGAAIGPIVATRVSLRLVWYDYFFVMLGLTGLLSVLFIVAFWDERKARTPIQDTQIPSMEHTAGLLQTLRYPVVPILATYLLLYVGAEVSLGGWIVSYMLEQRHASASSSSWVATGFWAGLTAGRFALGYPTSIIGEKLAATAYIAFAIALHLLFWLIPSKISSAVFVSLVGFFLGPLFPVAISLATKIIPRRSHIAAVGFCAAIGGAGGAAFPFIAGAIAGKKGVGSVVAVVLALLGAMEICWISVPARWGKWRTD